MKLIQVFCVILTLLISYDALSQERILFLSGPRNIYSLDIENCVENFLVECESNFTDISFIPNGNLYGISSNGILLSIDLGTGETDLIHIFDQTTGNNYTSLTANGEGIIYTAKSNGRIYSYDLSRDLEIFIGTMPFGAAGDLTFFNGNLYVATNSGEIALVSLQNPANSEIVISADIPSPILGIVTFGENCDDYSLYGFSERIFSQSIPSTMYKIDLVTGNLIEECEFIYNIFGGASTVEFIASNPVNLDSINIIGDCSTYEVRIFASGGVGQISYALNNETKSDGVFRNVPHGEYEFLINDENGCVLSQSIFLSDEFLEIESIYLEYYGCADSSGIISISPPVTNSSYLYSIDGGISYTDSNIFSDLSTGFYEIVVLDSNGCTADSIVNLNDENIFFINDVITTPATCNINNGSMTFVTNMGGLLYSINGQDYVGDSIFSDLASSVYQVSVKDSSECTEIVSAIVDSVTAPILNDFEIVVQECRKNLLVDYNAVGGEISLNNIDYTSGQQLSLSDSDSLISLFIRDSFGCIQSEQISVPPLLIPVIDSLGIENSNCKPNSGKINIIPRGLGLNYTYVLSGISQQTSIFENVGAGEYDIRIIDDFGCISNDTMVQILGGSGINANNLILQPSICGASSGIIEYIDSIDASIYVYNTENSLMLSGMSRVDNLPQSNYHVEVFGADGCAFDTIISVIQLECPVYIPSSFSPNGDNKNDEFRIYFHPDFSGVFHSLMIYDRYGGLMFENNVLDSNAELFWDGKSKGETLLSGVYIYVISYQDSTESAVKIKSGVINLIR